MFYIFKRHLPIKTRSVKKYIKSWKAMLGENGITGKSLQKEMFDHLYENLNILDGKTNSLLQFNAIMIMSMTLFIALEGSTILKESAYLIFVLGIIFATLSVTLCHFVIWVHWSKGRILEDAEKHINILVKVRNDRTVVYRRAWALSLIAISCMAYIFLYQSPLGDFIRNWSIPNVITEESVLFFALGVVVFIFLWDDLVIAVFGDDY